MLVSHGVSHIEMSDLRICIWTSSLRRNSPSRTGYSLERIYLACVSIYTTGQYKRRSCNERDENPRASATDRSAEGNVRRRPRGLPLCPRSGPRKVFSASLSAVLLSPNSRILCNSKGLSLESCKVKILELSIFQHPLRPITCTNKRRAIIYRSIPSFIINTFRGVRSFNFNF